MSTLETIARHHYTEPDPPPETWQVDTTGVTITPVDTTRGYPTHPAEALAVIAKHLVETRGALGDDHTGRDLTRHYVAIDLGGFPLTDREWDNLCDDWPIDGEWADHDTYVDVTERLTRVLGLAHATRHHRNIHFPPTTMAVGRVWG